MTRILGISGSLRKASYNAGLLRAAAEAAPAGVTFDARTIHGVPLYDADVEAEGVPGPVAALKDALKEADGLLLVTPEYNNGIPGVFKNAIDWMGSRSAGDPDLFTGKPVALMGASPGNFGTMLSQAHWLPVLRTLGTRPWFEGRLQVARAGTLFDADGNLTDEATRKRVAAFVEGFARFIGGG